ncbi:alpha/beta hydrolase [Actinoplanes sp. NPDC051861]|uniref:alpha/beta hydrolase n=1 Tax=Actinoplanes sp. NPDC051861 TaxID=3155170 RepID=UPI00341401C7
MADVRQTLRLDLIGSTFATALLCLSFTPSLLPRGWILQGVVGGVCAATGYALGCLPRAVMRRWHAGRRAWFTFALLAVPATSLAAYQGWRWQQEICRIMGVAGPSGATWPAALLVAGALFAGLLGAAALMRRGGAVLGHREHRHRAAATLVALSLLAGGSMSASGPLGALSTALDGRVTDLAAPSGTTRAGSPGSLVPWSSLGRQGRAFVTGALTVRHTTSPIRVYAGLGSAPTTGARARLAVAELTRTGAFSRKVLCLVVPTGSGWVDEPTVAALEDEFDGDTAIAAVQYAALPSWLALATEPERAEDAATDLLDEVRRTWSALPAAGRPKLLIYGHSLGALAAQAPFDSARSLLDRVDGALISGTPSSSPLRNSLVAGRSRATTEVRPALPGRSAIRFATGSADLVSAAGPSPHPRVLFLQHATDPVVWWSPRLMLRQPDWLRERRGDAVLPSVRWWPIVTFWQLSADMLKAQDVPAGYGHRYGAEARAAWHLITGGTGCDC